MTPPVIRTLSLSALSFSPYVLLSSSSLGGSREGLGGSREGLGGSWEGHRGVRLSLRPFVTRFVSLLLCGLLGATYAVFTALFP